MSSNEARHKKIEIMENQVRTTINISDLQVGMTVLHNGVLLTVGKNDFNKNEHGVSFRGDASSKTITRVQFLVPTLNGEVLRG
jgi:riboflavin synthase alpha subunit